MKTSVYNKTFRRTVNKSAIPACNILGVDIAAIDMQWLLNFLDENISNLSGDYTCVSNVHREKYPLVAWAHGC